MHIHTCKYVLTYKYPCVCVRVHKKSRIYNYTYKPHIQTAEKHLCCLSSNIALINNTNSSEVTQFKPSAIMIWILSTAHSLMSHQFPGLVWRSMLFSNFTWYILGKGLVIRSISILLTMLTDVGRFAHYEQLFPWV